MDDTTHTSPDDPIKKDGLVPQASNSPKSRVPLPTTKKKNSKPSETVTEQRKHGKTQAEKSGERSLNKSMLIAVGIVAVAAAGVYGYRSWQYNSTHEFTDDAYVTGNIHPVGSRLPGTVVLVAVDDNQTVNQGDLLVELDPKDYQAIMQKAQAALETAQQQANAAFGDINSAAQTANGNTTAALGKISEAIAAIGLAQTSAQAAQAAIPLAQAAVQQAQDTIVQAQAKVNEANAKLADTQVTYQRSQTLHQQGEISRRQLDNSQAEYQAALANKQAVDGEAQQAQAKLAQATQLVAAAKANYATAQQQASEASSKLAATLEEVEKAKAAGVQTDVNRQHYEAATAQIVQAKAALDEAQLKFSYSNIVASVPGKVANKTVQVGQKVQSGQPLMTIVSDRKWVVANFKETQMGKIKPGQQVDITIKALPSKSFSGHINHIVPASGSDFSLLLPDNAKDDLTKLVQRIPVKITLDPKSIKGYEDRIKKGMSVKAAVDVTNKKK